MAVQMVDFVNTFQGEVLYIIRDVLSPIFSMLTVICQYIGFGFILYGLSRLHGHGSHNGSQRLSPWGTGMAFAAGTVLACFTPELSALSYSMSGLNPHFYNTCPGGSLSGKEHIYYCPILGYAQEAYNVPAGGDPTTQAIKTLGFA